MHRKHYKAIADIINEFSGDGNGPNTLFEQQKFDALVEAFVSLFEQDNPRFDRNRFFEAVRRYGE
jgi:replication fork clamp-binding protein CrfC